MSDLDTVPPALSTSDTHIFEKPIPAGSTQPSKYSDEEIDTIYEVQRTAAEIKQGKWYIVALQFPDEMLQDAPRVFEALQNELRIAHDNLLPAESLTSKVSDLSVGPRVPLRERLYILADTSYGACCVDEIAAEHVDADVVVHYGRACLSPAARLPVIHVFTHQYLDHEMALKSFENTHANKDEKVILMADVTYTSHLHNLGEVLKERGYFNIYITAILHDPSSPLPNRTVPLDVQRDISALKSWQLFHISDPPQSLLLTLSSRLSAIYIYPTSYSGNLSSNRPLLATTTQALRRRYALLTSLNTVSVFGILINTLSIKNYLHIVEHVKQIIRAARKKSYTFVVGKVNVAKVANFSEIGGWVVIGCWESSLIESKDFWKPVITPFELELALKSDEERVWSGEWRGDFQEILDRSAADSHSPDGRKTSTRNSHRSAGEDENNDTGSESESEPPEFDLRTGRYVSHSRPMRSSDFPVTKKSGNDDGNSPTPTHNSLVRRAENGLTLVGGEFSPGADFLQSKRSWKGLGSDFEIAYDESGKQVGGAIEEGRSGIARGYVDGPSATKR
ncbi:Diphthamide biosynthesis protein 2 [Varicellaria rhodocarpa]|nr:Diphthamide biosynthesis protein 2 [Varicellaria rhodocarpa]